MFVIGTAGHVDHGKSTLIEALSGIDPDRLAEEKERAMTIDLGFAWMTMEIKGEAQEVGIIDVPGHRDFIENMLAGIGGIDLALFVVAADEGVMPQTSEHLAIIDLLEIPAGVIALTKVDLVEDTDWLELVILDLQESLEGTVLEDAPVVPVSARTGEGIAALHAKLAARLAISRPRPDAGRPRLPIDRVFTLSGFGTIVTGTLTGGSVGVGDAVEIQPGGLQGRIRGLQTHKTKRDVALPGSRVAVNISGIDARDIRRGQILAAPGRLKPTILIDVQYRHLVEAQKPLKHNVEVKLFTGASEVMARTRVLGARAIEPGQTGWLQLALESPLAVARGDHYILRRPSPGATIGGGLILDPHPGRRHRRFRKEVVARLQTLAEGTPEELLLQKLERLQPVAMQDLILQSGLPEDDALSAWQELVKQRRVKMVGSLALTEGYWRSMRQAVQSRVETYHQDYPLRRGVPREELRNRLGLAGPVFNALVQELSEEGLVSDSGTAIHDPSFRVTLNEGQQQRVDELLSHLKESGVNSPSVKECKSLVGEGVYNALVEQDVLRQLNEDVVYRAADFRRIKTQIIDFITAHESAGAAEVRDLLDTSRKYAIAILEYLDKENLTRRVGDERVLVTPVRTHSVQNP